MDKYEERVKALAEEMAEIRRRFLYCADLPFDEENENKTSIELAHIAVKHMADCFEMGALAYIYNNVNGAMDTVKEARKRGLIPSPADEAQNNVE